MNHYEHKFRNDFIIANQQKHSWTIRQNVNGLIRKIMLEKKKMKNLTIIIIQFR